MPSQVSERLEWAAAHPPCGAVACAAKAAVGHALCEPCALAALARGSNADAAAAAAAPSEHGDMAVLGQLKRDGLAYQEALTQALKSFNGPSCTSA